MIKKKAKARATSARPKARRVQPRRVTESELSEPERLLLAFDRLVRQYETDAHPRDWRLAAAHRLDWNKAAWGDELATPTPDVVLALTLRIQEWLARGPDLERTETKEALRRIQRLVTGAGGGRIEVLLILDRAKDRRAQDQEGSVRLGLRRLLGPAKEESVSDETIRAMLAAWAPVAGGQAAPSKWKPISEFLVRLGFPRIAPESVAREWRQQLKRLKTPESRDPPSPRKSETSPGAKDPA